MHNRVEYTAHCALLAQSITLATQVRPPEKLNGWLKKGNIKLRLIYDMHVYNKGRGRAVNEQMMSKLTPSDLADTAHSANHTLRTFILPRPGHKSYQTVVDHKTDQSQVVITETEICSDVLISLAPFRVTTGPM